MWTLFLDGRSGGGVKIKKYECVCIELPISLAMVVFYRRFKRDPYHITCECCGQDFDIYEYKTKKEMKEFLVNVLIKGI